MKGIALIQMRPRKVISSLLWGAVFGIAGIALAVWRPEGFPLGIGRVRWLVAAMAAALAIASIWLLAVAVVRRFAFATVSDCGDLYLPAGIIHQTYFWPPSARRAAAAIDWETAVLRVVKESRMSREVLRFRVSDSTRSIEGMVPRAEVVDDIDERWAAIRRRFARGPDD